MYEAAESGILFLLNQIQDFQSDYKTLVVATIVKDYHAKLVVADESRNLIIEGRNNRISVEDHASEYMKKYHQLRAVVAELSAARTDLNTALRKSINETRAYVIGVVIAAAGTFAAIVRLIS